MKETKAFVFSPLSEVLNEYKIPTTIKDEIEYKQVSVRLYGNGVSLREIQKGTEILTKKQFLVKSKTLIYGTQNLARGAIGILPDECDGAVITQNMRVFEISDSISPKYLEFILQSTKFVSFVEELEHGAARAYIYPASFLPIQIPLPPLKVQNEIVEKIEKQKQIIEGAEKIDVGFSVDQFIDTNYGEEFIEKLAQVDGSPVKDLSKLMSETYVGGENIESGSGRLLNLQTVQEAGIIGPSYEFKKGHVVYSKVRPNLQKCFFADFKGVCSSDIYPLKVNDELVLPKYFALTLQSKFFAKKTESFQDGRSGMPKINQDQLAQIKIPLPPLEAQRQIVEKLDRQMQALEGVRLLKSEAERRIEEILAGVWGE
ncbi:restriction endonuclease subunit S [Patescibacteria group bacterium]|nr:restriction endonuclease subunit S [Patescibacteria group bacterium]